ncbi:hypothetical protein LAZ67_20001845 [Cordylochernes scorpioides]|uniref:Uncharacterized protein n=1 Tax=Cordylochernes scorpioides TaxID=51811 RepID=A0ABY6LN93_9ARAC|nr:hypothetical protein LAZ67_20001845 [Cordylochernes scorpioides]
MSSSKIIIRYLKGTKGLGLCYTSEYGTFIKAFCDASWRDRKNKEKSITGITTHLGSCLISWMSKSEDNTALSTCDSEMNALLTCYKRCVYLKYLIEELFARVYHKNVNFNIKINCDNQSAITLCQTGVTSLKSNHIIRTVNFLHENLIVNNYTISFTPSSDNLSDLLTKAVSKDKLRNTLKMINVV